MLDFTEYLYFGLRGERCVASGWKRSGKGADRENARMVSDWIKRGMDVVTLHKDDPIARAHFDQMYADASVSAERTKAAKAAVAAL